MVARGALDRPITIAVAIDIFALSNEDESEANDRRVDIAIREDRDAALSGLMGYAICVTARSCVSPLLRAAWRQKCASAVSAFHAMRESM